MKRVPILLAVIASLVVVGIWISRPTSATDLWVETTRGILVNGTPRQYLLVKPEHTDLNRLPVLVVLHGRDASPEGELKRTDFTSVVGDAILVYPAGVGETWDAGDCCPPASDLGVDDVSFITDVVHDVLATQPEASHTELYLAGYSNGGRMTYEMACDAPGLFAGYAAVGAAADAPCPTAKPTSLLAMVYNADPEVALGTVTEQVDAIRSLDGCDAAVRRDDRGTLSQSSWDACNDRDHVSLAVYDGVSHDWPPGDAFTPSAARVIWQFFQSLKTSAEAAAV